MSDTDIEALLAEISPDSPCGEDMEYEPLFQEMERAGQGKPEQVMGDSVIEAEDPDWKELRRKAIEVLGQSKDLRAGVFLSRALLNTDGFDGFRDGLQVVAGLIGQYWGTLHPELDPDDDNDPTIRVNNLESLADQDATLRFVREAPLVSHQVLGRYSLREMEIASGESQLPANWKGEPPDSAAIHAAFMDVDLEQLTGTADAIAGCLDNIAAIEAGLLEHLAPAQTPDLEPLIRMLQRIKKALAEPLEERGVTDESEQGEGGEGDGAGAGSEQRIAGEITSREDVARVLDKICDFYRKSEPSSPVPLLLTRAKRLITLDFMDIMKDLAPGGVSEVEVFRGPEDD